MTRRRGFSLVELMVALAFVAVLLGGLGQIHGHCLQASNRIHEGLRLQRTLRLAQAALTDEFRMIGYRYPLPEGEPQPLDPGQATFLHRPGQGVPKVRGGGFLPRAWADDPQEPVDKRVDELIFLRDVPIEAGAVLAADLAVPPDPLAVPSVQLRADPGGALEEGDLLILEDGRLDWATLAAAATLPRRGTLAVALAPPGLRSAHAAGGRVALVRPRRLVRLAAVYLQLEGAAARVPCLVRFEAALPPGGGVPSWAGMLARPRAGPGAATVVAEQITGFQVEVVPGSPQPGANPDTTGKPGCDPIPHLLRVTLEARSALPRAEFAQGGQRDQPAFLYRSLTWMVAPGNTGLDRPP